MMVVDRANWKSMITLDHESFVPIHRQISDALRRLIIDGKLSMGKPLPSVRELAVFLDVSRSTVLRSFEDLASQGYIESIPGSGTHVRKNLPGETSETGLAITQVIKPRENVELSSYGQRLLKTTLQVAQQDQHIPELNFGGPSLELTPIAQWRQLLERNCRLKDPSRLEYSQEPFGYPPLREAYAAYLTRARAVRCSADQVAVFSARELRLDLICRLLIEQGDYVAVEDPGYPGIRSRFLSHGANVVAIKVGRDGLDVNELIAHKHHFKFLYVAPSYNEPTGAFLSLSARKRLIDWAARTGTFIVEDDYASEYRYTGRPLPSLQGLDSADVVIHLSCLWKVLFPVVRLGFLVLPRCLTEAFSLAKALVENDLPLVDQFALTDFINEGHLERQIRRTRAIYGKRRQALVGALDRCFGERVKISSEAAGFELLVKLETNLTDEQVSRIAQEARLPLVSSRLYYVQRKVQGEFVVSFAQFDQEAIEQSVINFSRSLS